MPEEEQQEDEKADEGQVERPRKHHQGTQSVHEEKELLDTSPIGRLVHKNSTRKNTELHCCTHCTALVVEKAIVIRYLQVAQISKQQNSKAGKIDILLVFMLPTNTSNCYLYS